MKTSILAFVATLGSASAFAPSNGATRMTPLKSMSAEIDGMIGVDVETGNQVFDPLGLSERLPLDYARKAELSNGRSAMLATVGWVWPKMFGLFDASDVTTTDPIDAIMQADPQWWAQFFLLCGVIESYKYKGELEGKSFSGPGEPVLDWSNSYPSDPAAREKLHLQELKNGRLAMIAMAAYFSEHFIPGSVPLMPSGWA